MGVGGEVFFLLSCVFLLMRRFFDCIHSVVGNFEWRASPVGVVDHKIHIILRSEAKLKHKKNGKSAGLFFECFLKKKGNFTNFNFTNFASSWWSHARRTCDKNAHRLLERLGIEKPSVHSRCSKISKSQAQGHWILGFLMRVIEANKHYQPKQCTSKSE